MKNIWLKKSVAHIMAVALGAGSGFASAGQPAGTMLPGSAANSDEAQVSAAGAVQPNFKPKSGSTAAAFSSSRIIVKFKSSAQPPANFEPSSAPPAVQSQHPATVAKQMTAALPKVAQSALARIQGRPIKGYADLGVMVVDTPIGVGRAIEALYRSGTVEYAEPDFKVKALTTPNDPQFSQLWAMQNTGQTGGTPGADINATLAWDTRTSSGANVVIGIVDTGIDYTHPDLKLNLWKNPGETAGNGIDDDGNGYIDDVYGIDACNHDSDPMDDHYHGTHVAGTIGGKGNNGAGITGVAWSNKMMALKFLCSDGSGWTSDAVEAINYAIAMKKRYSYKMILSNSWGGGGYSQALYDTIAAARDAGILFVAAAGNDGMNTDIYQNYPSGYDLANIVVVGATDHNDTPAWFSNRGCSSVHLFAPGVDILSTAPGGNYQLLSGTSMATPHVSGMAALIWAQYPSASWQKIKNALLNGVDGKSSLDQLAVTQGRANAATAMQAGMQTLPTVWRVSPANAVFGDAITIQGQNFGSTTGSVSFNGTPLTVKSWSSSTIKAVVPQGGIPAGPGTLAITAGSATSHGACMNLTLAAKPIGNTIIPHAWSASAQVNDNVWIFGGGTTWGQTALVERFTLGTNRSVIDSAWTMPQPVTNHGAAAIGTKVYVVGGFDWNTEQVFDTLQIFDTTTGTWTTGAKLPQALLQPNVVALAGKIYVLGGFNASQSVVGTTYVYDPSSDSWKTGAAMPAPAGFSAVARYGTTNRAWVMGGFTAPFLGSETSAVYQFDADTGKWMTKAPLTTVRGGSAGAFYANAPHTLYGSSYGSVLRSGERVTNAAWLADIDGGTQLYTPMTGAAGGYLYILGGSNLFDMSSVVWRLKE